MSLLGPRKQRTKDYAINQIKGIDGIPLYYVIRDPEMETTYQTENRTIGGRIFDAEHRGRAYEQDAFRVMQILRQWTSGGTVETYTDKTENVQDAWNEMIKVFEGVDAKGATIQQARDTIRLAHWSRDTPNFKFVDYCTKHILANNH